MRLLRALAPLLLPACLPAQIMSPHVGEQFWELSESGGISWTVAGDPRLPHADHLEMSGQRVATILEYEVDADGYLRLRREVIYPQWRIPPTQRSPDWFRYRAYLRETYGDEVLPVLLVDGRRHAPAPVDRIDLDGSFRVRHQADDGLVLERTLAPSMTERLLVEHWTVRNVGSRARRVEVLPATIERAARGPDGSYRLVARTRVPSPHAEVPPGEASAISVSFEAAAAGDPLSDTAPATVLAQREAFLREVSSLLRLETPDPVLNTLFRLAKVRATESIYDSRLGLIHSPGGGNYYVGVWANDQAEYSGPFFAYLGYPVGQAAALNAYRTFLERRPRDGGRIFSSFEMQGELPCCSKDRGDAAMLAYGASHYALASGDPAVGRTLWPLIAWGLEYSHGRLNAAGVVESESDEMEGRLPTGRANLATSSLYYGALQLAADLARALALEPPIAAELDERAARLAAAIERHFGATVAGLKTYRYFEGHEALRHWISLPLAMGLTERVPDTLTALLERMWTIHGVRVEWAPDGHSPELYWDRGTLYALRAAFLAGAEDRALARLQEYSRTRLLGFHVPYPIEAWPENNMRHLSAESALYCRIFTEGLLGLRPTGFDRFVIQPRLPAAWKREGYAIRNLRLGGRASDIAVQAGTQPETLRVRVTYDGRNLLDRTIRHGERVEVRWP